MAFHIVIDLIPPQQSNFVINTVHVIGEPDKPNIALLPGRNPKLAEKLHACHISAWKIIATAIGQQITGVPLREAAKAVFKFNDFQADNVSAPQIKEFMEASIKQTLKQMQERVSNYYAGSAQANMRGGGKMGSAIRSLNDLYQQYQSSQFAIQKMSLATYQTQALPKQIALFRAAYDESPFQSNAEKALARGEYVAFWYQIYHGGTEDSIRLAQFLIDTPEGQLAIEHLILNGT